MWSIDSIKSSHQLFGTGTDMQSGERLSCQVSLALHTLLLLCPFSVSSHTEQPKPSSKVRRMIPPFHSVCPENIHIHCQPVSPFSLRGHLHMMSTKFGRDVNPPGPSLSTLLVMRTYRARLKGGSQVAWLLQASQAEVVSKSSKKIHQTWGPPFGRALHKLS